MKIPFISIPDRPLSAPSQNHLPIADIVDDVVMYKDGGAATAPVGGRNCIGLLSEKEQQAVIAAYAALLNSLSFAIQIVIRSQRKNISSYLEYLDKASNKIQNPKLVEIMTGYKSFVAETIKKKNVLGKRFFIVIPFSPLELGVTKSVLSAAKKGPLPYPKSYSIKKAKVSLYPKRDHLIRQAGRLSIKLKQLSTSELVDLFYDIYTPQVPATKSKEDVA